jgi:hypothetical protein
MRFKFAIPVKSCVGVPDKAGWLRSGPKRNPGNDRWFMRQGIGLLPARDSCLNIRAGRDCYCITTYRERRIASLGPTALPISCSN